MPTTDPSLRGRPSGLVARALLSLTLLGVLAAPGCAADPPGDKKPHAGGEASLVLPGLNKVGFFGAPDGSTGIGGKDLLYTGLVVSVIGLGFGLMIFSQLKNLPVHKTMLEVSELIYETCKTY